MTDSDPATLARNLHTIREQIQEAATRVDRSAETIDLIAVSKGQSPQKIRALHSSTSHKDYGENYLDELEEKANLLKDLPLNWHYIGHLQSNKIQRIVASACSIHTVSSPKHARYIDRYAAQLDKTPFPVYIAVNIAGEPQKSGVRPEQVQALADEISATCPHIHLCGIMSVPPSNLRDHKPSDLPEEYAKLKQLAATVGSGALSLGMSSDLELAIAAGSTCVRVGTAIFGERNHAERDKSVT